MSKWTYVYDNLRDPEKSISTSSVRQIADITGMNYRGLCDILQKEGIYFEPTGRFKISKLLFVKDKRERNGNKGNFNKDE